MMLDIRGLTVTYPGVRAVDDVELTVTAGECFAVVGESGCGKTTLARAVMGLVRPDAGTISLDGHAVRAAGRRRRRDPRPAAQIVFQNPYAALNPRMTVARLLDEPLRITHPRTPAPERRQRMLGLLADVGLTGDLDRRYPHELSGGQCQRVAIARALAMEPRLLVLDEPTSALDVSVQAQVLNLLADLHRDRELTYLLISHDLAVVRHLADRVGVMLAGRLVEQGRPTVVLTEPEHPYTRTLLSATPGQGRAALLSRGSIP